MFCANQLFMGLVSGIFLVVLVSPGVAAEGDKKEQTKNAFPQAGIINTLHAKLVCGKKDPGQRFVISGKEVCDRTTGEIWEQNPNSLRQDNPDGRSPMTQTAAIAFCANLDKGYGQVYELPSVQQLQDLLDYREMNPTLTPGVFENVSALYWSASLTAENVALAWGVDFFDGILRISPTTDEFFVWCVRRGKNSHGAW